MRKKTILLTVLAAVLLLSVSIGPALGYFTDHDEESGEASVAVKPWTMIRESFDSWTKHVVITNYVPEGVDEGAPCFVRARAYMAGNEDGQALSISGDGWTGSGSNDWYYYGTILQPKPTEPYETSPLDVKIIKIPQNPKNGDSFNVIVVYEAAPVIYKNGSAAADWSQAIEIIQTGG